MEPNWSDPVIDSIHACLDNLERTKSTVSAFSSPLLDALSVLELQQRGAVVLHVGDSPALFASEGHIPGARFVPVTALDNPLQPSSRAPAHTFVTLAGLLGVSPDTSVIFTGSADPHSCELPCRAFWMFKLFQHPGDLFLYNGGIQRWRQQGHEVSHDHAALLATTSDYEARRAVVCEDARIWATAEDMELLCANPDPSDCLLLSVHPNGSLKGCQCELQLEGGAAIAPEGGFKPLEDLAHLFSPVEPWRRKQVVLGSAGGHSAQSWFVLSQLLGFPRVKRLDLNGCVQGNTSSSITSPLKSPAPTKHVVLVGGGHAHAQVIKALNWASRAPGVQVFLIDPLEKASYSGMVPGAVSRMYTPELTQIDLRALAAWARVQFIQGWVTSVDPLTKMLTIEPVTQGGLRSLRFDVVSLDVGSRSRDTETPGVAEFCIPTRPIHMLVHRIQQRISQLVAAHTTKVRCVVVGAGAAGIELAFSAKRLCADNFGGLDNAEVTLVDAGAGLLMHDSEMARAYMSEAMARRGIKCVHNARILRVDESVVVLENLTELPYELVIWATGARSQPVAQELAAAGVSTTPRGWVEVNEHMQSLSCSSVFAAGDCSHIVTADPVPPKAGVYAVRTGPILIHNLQAYLEDEPLVSYHPQDDFMRLFNTSDNSAIGLRYGIAFRGEWVWHVKDTIDQNFMNLFKPENLPCLSSRDQNEAQAEQYDAKQNLHFSTSESPEEAAELLMYEGAEFERPWGVIKRMGSDEVFQRKVVEIVLSSFKMSR